MSEIEKQNNKKIILPYNRLKRKSIFVGILIIVIGVVLIFIVQKVVIDDKNYKDSQTNNDSSENFADYVKKNSETDEGKRQYISQLSYSDSNEEARSIAESLLEKTGDVQDAINLLQLCVVKDFKDKAKCAENAIPVIKNNANKLDFYDAYSTAEMTEKIGQKMVAAGLYERAYDQYIDGLDSTGIDYMTKAEIEQRIKELRG